MSKKYDNPYFVTNHAIKRFQERASNVSAAKAIGIINGQLQSPGLPVDADIAGKRLSLIYQCRYKSKAFYPLVAKEEGREWPAVVTVLGEESALHKKIKAGFPKKSKWAKKDDEILLHLLQEGYSQKECAQIMRWSTSTIHKYMPETAKPRGSIRRWSEQEKELLIKYKFAGWSYKRIAQKLGRSESAIRIQMCRHKKKIREDPELMNVVKVLSFCLNPGRLLSSARKSGLLSEIREQEEERKINDNLIRKAVRDW